MTGSRRFGRSSRTFSRGPSGNFSKNGEPCVIRRISKFLRRCSDVNDSHRQLRFKKESAGPPAMPEEQLEGPLLLELAKESFRKQIAKRVRPLARSYVEKWMGCELWLYSAVIQRHGNELHSYKAVVLETLRKTPVDELLQICRATRPDLDDLWKKPAARDKLKKEIAKAIEAVEAI